MSNTVFKGRPVIPGSLSGEALVSRGGFNLLAAYQTALVLRSKKAPCGDQNNPDLYGRGMSGKVLCLPQTIGSTTGGLAIHTAAYLGIAPAAFLFADHIDSLAAAGVILADIWLQNRIVTVDSLGRGFLEAVRTGEVVEIDQDGTVRIRK